MLWARLDHLSNTRLTNSGSLLKPLMPWRTVTLLILTFMARCSNGRWCLSIRHFPASALRTLWRVSVTRDIISRHGWVRTRKCRKTSVVSTTSVTMSAQKHVLIEPRFDRITYLLSQNVSLPLWERYVGDRASHVRWILNHRHRKSLMKLWISWTSTTLTVSHWISWANSASRQRSRGRSFPRKLKQLSWRSKQLQKY